MGAHVMCVLGAKVTCDMHTSCGKRLHAYGKQEVMHARVSMRTSRVFLLRCSLMRAVHSRHCM